jgi:hypothetical protein
LHGVPQALAELCEPPADGLLVVDHQQVRHQLENPFRHGSVTMNRVSPSRRSQRSSPP